VALAAAIGLGVGGVGCRSAPPKAVARPLPARAAVTAEAPARSRPAVAGRVAYVDREQGVAILECTVLPAGQPDISVARGGVPVARLRVLDRRRGPYVAAEILEGTPRKGDSLTP
jgi:hypothetical protein